MSDDPSSKKPDWIEQELEPLAPKTPMFYSDLSRDQRRKRSKDRAEEKSKRENISRNFQRLGIFLLFAGVGVLGYFAGIYHTGAPVSSVTPVAESGQIFEAPPEAIKYSNEVFQYKERRDYASALETLEKIVETQPDMPGIYYQLAETSFKLKNFKQAQAYAERGLEKNNQPDLCQMILALIAWQKRNDMTVFSNDKIAVATAEKAVAMNPFGTYPLYFLAEFKRESGAYAEGGDLLQEASRRVDPLDSLIILRTKARLAMVQSQRDSFRDGKVDEKLVSMDASSMDQRMCQALVYLYQGKSGQAAATLKTARSVLPQELFMILINDPAFREFQLDPLLQEFFKTDMPAEKNADEENKP